MEALKGQSRGAETAAGICLLPRLVASTPSWNHRLAWEVCTWLQPHKSLSPAWTVRAQSSWNAPDPITDHGWRLATQLN